MLTRRWTGLLGSTGSYMSVYVFLFISTTHHLGKDFVTPSASSSGFSAQMTIWHNLLAIWLWRCLLSAVEGLQIPGVISVQGWILYHLPSYYLWITGAFFLMLMTKKTASGGVSRIQPTLGVAADMTESEHVVRELACGAVRREQEEF